MLRNASIAALLALPACAQVRPPRILEVYRDFVKPGSFPQYNKIEEDAAGICAELKCPHPYVGLESLNGPKEVWLNGFASEAELKQVVEDYAKNAALMAALNQIAKRKKGLIGEAVNVFATYREELSRGAPWDLAHGRFLVITMTKSRPKIDGTVFETADGTRFIVTPAQTRPEACAKARVAGPETNVFAVRPSWSLPAKEWVATDPAFWLPSRVAKADL